MFGTRRMHDPVGPAVVVADNDPAMRGLLSHALRHAGYRPYTAMDVPQAMDRFVRPGVAAAIVDMLFVNSGGRSGLDLLQFVRHDAHMTHLPVIVLTGFPLNRTVVAEVDAYHAELWYKPIDPTQIIDRLCQLVGASGYAQVRRRARPDRVS